jgi:GNAT superfamily N-acetyltransferase
MSTWHRGDYSITTDKDQLDLPFIHEFLSTKAYWSIGRGFDLVKRSIDHSLSFGLFKDHQQIGFARVVTDFATFAWLADVFVIEVHRGHGLGAWLIEVITNHPELQGLRRWILATRDAHDLYRRVGFSELATPQRWMERLEDKRPHEVMIER